MTDRHEHLDEGTIHAWLDGALPPDESVAVETAAASCAECAALVAEARGLIAASSRILSSLDTVPAGVIPGTSAHVDQLAALRARQRASTRRWWQDRRYLAAASLVLVAGISSLVLRSSPDEATLMRTEPVADSSVTVPVQPSAVADAAPPASTSAPVATREASVGPEAKAEAAPPTRDVVRPRAAATAPIDSASMQKVTVTSAPPPPPIPAPVSGVAANEARRDSIPLRMRLADSLVGQRLARQDVAAESQLRPQVQSRQALQQQQPQADSTARARLGAASLRLSEVVVTGVGAAKAERAELAGACFRLRGLTAPAVADTIRLLNEMAPVLSDPSWFRTQLYGALRDTTLAWRSIDSVTVELRAHFGSDTSAVRFRIDGAIPNAVALSKVRPAIAERVACPR